MQYKAEIGFEGTIPSMNFIYKPGIRAKRYPYLYKDKRVVAFQADMIERGEKTCLVDIRKEENVQSLDVHIVFRIKRNFWRRDVTNMIKAAEDALVTIIGIDDSKTVSLTAEKKLDKRRTSEGMTIKVKINYDNG